MSETYHPWTTYILAREEARRRGDRKVGTDHLLLGLTYEPTLAPALGFDLHSGREALVALDDDALTTVLGAAPDAPPVPSREPGPELPKPTLKAVLRDRLPLTPAAKSALQEAGKPMRRGHRIEPGEVLLALLALDRPDPGATLLDALGVDRGAVREKLAA
jgi:hypothetical protein